MTFSCSTGTDTQDADRDLATRTQLGAMRAPGRSLLGMLLVSAALLSGTVLAHVHDSSAVGLYDAECPVL